MDRNSAVRQLVLVVVVFAATLVVLVGLTGVIGRAPAATPRGTVIAAASSSATAVPSTATEAPASPSTSTSTTPGSSAPTVAPPPMDDPVLVGAGDIASCDSDGDEATAALLDRIDGIVFTAGDNAYDDGSAEDFRDCYDPSWGRHRDRTWPAAGNHDWRTTDLAGYRDYFGPAATGPDGASWYARDLGTWRVIVLDSDCEEVDGCGPDSPQGRWLAAELAASRATCTVAIFHVPRFSSGDEHGSDPSMDPFWRALYAAGVDVIVNGHDHDYERFAPQDPDGREDRERGIREFVVGTGGRELRGFDEIAANSELAVNVDHGVLALTLRDGAYAWQFHAATTDFSDSGTAFCH
jgi:hypothetical protein